MSEADVRLHHKGRRHMSVPQGSFGFMDSSWTPLALGVHDLDAEDPEEQMGSKDKNWVRVGNDDRRWLVKIARVDDRDGTVSGEDWAEWVVQFIAGQLTVPTALVRPATFGGQRATASRSMLRDDSERLIHGNELLSARFDNYEQSVRGENPGYTLTAIRAALADIPGPREFEGPLDAFDTFVGYLVCDALVAGRDRHHENWGVIRRGEERWLAPSFDHGNALGFQERDDRRARMLSDEAHLLRWLSRGTSQHFVGRPLLTDLAITALNAASPDSRAYWWEMIQSFDLDAAESVIHTVPDDLMSEVSRRFVFSLLSTNRRRLLDGYRAPDS